MGKKQRENLSSPQATVICPHESRGSDSPDRKSGPPGLRVATARNAEVESNGETALGWRQSVTL